MTNFVSRFFPIPRYLQIPAVGVDLSDRSVKYLEFRKTSSGLRLKKFGRKSIGPSIIEGGVIENKEELIRYLKDFKKELGAENIIASLPEEKGFIKVVRVPMVDNSQIKKILEPRIEEILPFSAKEIVFDFEIIGRNDSKKELILAISAIPKSISREYAFVFKKAGFMPVAFELENQSLFRALTKSDLEGAFMVVDFGKTRTSFLVGENGFVKFSSTINVAGEDLNKALSRSLNVGIFEAERIKKKQLAVRSEDDGMMDIILPVISVVKDEIRRIMEYWTAHSEEQAFSNREIKNIILCGGDSNLIGFVEYLSYELKTDVKLGNVWMNITSFDDYIPEIEHRESMMYATAVGLALRAVRIND